MCLTRSRIAGLRDPTCCWLEASNHLICCHLPATFTFILPVHLLELRMISLSYRVLHSHSAQCVVMLLRGGV